MKTFAFGIAALSLLIASPALAEDDHGKINVQEMQTLTGLAIGDFGVNEPGHVQHLTGWKTWRSGADVKVKIYVTHDGMNMEFNYHCHKHGDGKLQCHAQ